MGIDITFNISDAELKRLEDVIIRKLGEDLQRKLNIDKYKILIKLQNYLEEVFWNNKIVKSLQSDSPDGLRADVGVGAEDMQTILDQILKALKKSILVQDFRVQKIGHDFRLISKITMMKENYSDLLSIEHTSYPSNGFEIEWLKWILYNAGEFVLVTRHNILRKLKEKDQRRSRSGLAIMVSNHQTVWRVPSWVFSIGHKNFIRTIADAVELKIAEFVSEEM